MSRDYSLLPREFFGSPGSERDRLVGLIVDGVKTGTASLHAEYVLNDEPLPMVGAEGLVIDSLVRAAAVIRTTGVRVCRFDDVDSEHAAAEGVSLEEWRRVHREVFSGRYYAELFGAPFVADGETLVVLQRFEVVQVMPASA